MIFTKVLHALALLFVVGAVFVAAYIIATAGSLAAVSNVIPHAHHRSPACLSRARRSHSALTGSPSIRLTRFRPTSTGYRRVS